MLEIGCAWSKGSGERLQGHHGPLVFEKASFLGSLKVRIVWKRVKPFSFESPYNSGWCGKWLTLSQTTNFRLIQTGRVYRWQF